MSTFRKIENQRRQLHELRSIITSMKTLARLELHKIGKIIQTQRSAVEILKEVLDDFQAHYPRSLPEEKSEIWLLIGSERGFCGAFNSLLRKSWSEEEKKPGPPRTVLAVGRRLSTQLEPVLPGRRELEGASSWEEIPAVLARAAAAIQETLEKGGASTVRVLCHIDEHNSVVAHQLLPPERPAGKSRYAFPPHLYLEPDIFFGEFLQCYLHMGLTELLSVSLLVENRYRLRHLEAAVNRLDEKVKSLSMLARVKRQEEITEEMEMILLGSAAYSFRGR